MNVPCDTRLEFFNGMYFIVDKASFNEVKLPSNFLTCDIPSIDPISTEIVTESMSCGFASMSEITSLYLFKGNDSSSSIVAVYLK